MVHPVKYLSCKHEALTLVPKSHVRKAFTPALENQRQEDP